MGTPSGLTLLQSITGYAQNVGLNENPSGNAPIRLAVIDPSYVATSYPTTLPRVTFEGEDAVTDKRYVCIDRSYQPGPGDRVLMLPAGHTYVIAGVITPALVAPIWEEADAASPVTTASTSFVSLSGGPSVSINLRAGQYARITVACQEYSDTAGANGVIMSFRSTGASGTTEAVDVDGAEAGVNNEWTPMFREKKWGPASSGGSHTFEARYRVIGTTTGNFKNRRISAEAK